MQKYLILFEPWIRLSLFCLFFISLTALERRFAWRFPLEPFKERLKRHLSLVVVSNFLIRLTMPLFLVGLAYKVQGMSQNSLLTMPELQKLPIWVHYVVGFLLLDFLMYWQHRIFHRIKLFWRIHLMHHTDNMLDASTGLRFHPIEYLAEGAFKVVGVLFIAPPPLAVLLFLISFNFGQLFTHSNLQLSERLEKWLRWVIVTPGMHRVHHSDIPEERDRNFGFFLSWWDRLLGTYLPFSRMGERKLVIGVEEFNAPQYRTIEKMLLQPFYSTKKRHKKPSLKKWMRRTTSEKWP